MEQAVEKPKNKGGRPPGAANKRSYQTRRHLDKMNFNPITNMCRIAIKAEKEGDLALAGQMNSQIAKYFAPQLKAVEVTGGIEHSGGVLLVTPRLEHNDWLQQAERIVEQTTTAALEHAIEDDDED